MRHARGDDGRTSHPRTPWYTAGAILIAVGLLVAGISLAGASGKGQSRTDVEKALTGTWRLTSTPIRDTSGNVVGSLYKHPVGRLTYTRRGDVWAFVGERDRTSASDPQLWYTGTFDVRVRRHEVVHHVRLASAPGIQGTDLVRHYRLHGDRLVLSTSAGAGRTVYLHWAREH